MMHIHSRCNLRLKPRTECKDILVMSDDRIVGWLHWVNELQQWTLELHEEVACSSVYIARIFETVTRLVGAGKWEKFV